MIRRLGVTVKENACCSSTAFTSRDFVVQWNEQNRPYWLTHSFSDAGLACHLHFDHSVSITRFCKNGGKVIEAVHAYPVLYNICQQDYFRNKLK